MKKIAVLVSGSGTNLQAVLNACKNGEINGRIEIVISSCPYAYALVRAQSEHIPNITLQLSDFKTKEDRDAEILKLLHQYNVDLVILAGYLGIIPKNIISEYPGKIVTLHASLLPKYGGKGFYGERIHRAVLAMREEESGATAFFVTNDIDCGPIIEQRKIKVNRGDTPDSLQHRILTELEHPMMVDMIRSLCADKLYLKDNEVVKLD